MALGDWRYYERVPEVVRNFIEEQDLPFPDAFADTGTKPPFYTPIATALRFDENLPEDFAREHGLPVDVMRTTVDKKTGDE